MAEKGEKVSTLIIESNLECEKCYSKIQKVLCKLQEKEKIRTINFDTKNNTVTVSGPFDPVKLSRKLRCKACEAIKDIKIVEEKEPKKTEEKKPEPKKEEKAEEKKPEEKKKPADECCKCCKKPDEKKPEEKKKPVDECCKCCKKHDEKKKPEEKKPEEKKPDEKPKPKEEPKPALSSTTVNLQFTQICNLCYPWPCSDPSHWGGVHQYPQPQPKPHQPPPQPQWPCEPPTMPAFPGHHQQPYPPWVAPATPKRQPCGGPSYCGGCGSCGGGYNGWPPAMPTPLQMMQPPPMGCGGRSSSCRGCNGCRIVQEGRFIYEEYPPSSCTVM